MKKIVLAIFLLFTTIGTASANQSGSTYYVKDFASISESALNLRQSVTGANYSCGPTSLLFVKNYYWKKNFGVNSWEGRYKNYAINSLYNTYQDLGQSYNSTTTTNALKNVAKNSWYWTAVKASGTNSISTNLYNMKQKFKANQPVILALKSNYAYNPVYGSAHIVIFYKYVGGNTNRLYYFEPYYGRAGGFNSMRVEDIPSAIQGNLPYLRVVPSWDTTTQ